MSKHLGLSTSVVVNRTLENWFEWPVISVINWPEPSMPEPDSPLTLFHISLDHSTYLDVLSRIAFEDALNYKIEPQILEKMEAYCC